MTDKELRVRAIQELEFYKKDDTFMLADITVDLAIEALEQLPSVNPQPCEDAISRQAVLEIQTKYAEHIGATKFWQMRDDIRALPPVTLQPKTGHWIAVDGDNAICSCCNRLNLLYGDYCKHCGAKMVKLQERSGKE